MLVSPGVIGTAVASKRSRPRGAFSRQGSAAGMKGKAQVWYPAPTKQNVRRGLVYSRKRRSSSPTFSQSSFRNADSLYKLKSAAERAQWKAAVKAPGMSGYDLWMKECLGNFHAGWPAPKSPSPSGGFRARAGWDPDPEQYNECWDVEGLADCWLSIDPDWPWHPQVHKLAFHVEWRYLDIWLPGFGPRVCLLYDCRDSSPEWYRRIHIYPSNPYFGYVQWKFQFEGVLFAYFTYHGPADGWIAQYGCATVDGPKWSAQAPRTYCWDSPPGPPYHWHKLNVGPAYPYT